MPVPTKPSTRTHNRYVSNIVAVFNRATPDQIQRGKDWYRVAHDVALTLASDAATGAGVIAAMSARTEWNDNIRRATRALSGDTTSGHTRDVLNKVRAIIDGTPPEAVLPMQLKTGNFYLSIVDPDNEESVVIDRHAHDVAVGRKHRNDYDRGLSSKARYAMFADAYRKAAKRIGNVTPSQLQAITWCTWVDETQYQRAK